MQQCWLEAADERPHFHDLVTTISNILESIAGYLDLQRSLSLVQRVKQDYSCSPHPTNSNSEVAVLEEEKEASTKAISSQVMEGVDYETIETAC